MNHMPLEVESTPVLDSLLIASIITQAQHEQAREKLKLWHSSLKNEQGGESYRLIEEPFTELGEALFWLLDKDILNGENLSQLIAADAADGEKATNPLRRRMLHEFEPLLDHKLIQREKERKAEFWNAVFPGSLWIFRIGCAATFLMVAGLAAYQFWPHETQACDNDTVLSKAVLSEYIHHDLAQRKELRLALRQREPDAFKGMRMGGVQQIGYSTKSKVRACRMIVDHSDDPHEVGFLINRDGGGRGFEIEFHPISMLRARYSHTDEFGSPKTRGSPIGDSSISKAISDGAESLRRESCKSVCFRVDDVETLEDCAVGSQPGYYACKVLIQYSEFSPSVESLATSKNPVEAVIDFRRDAASWRVASSFPEQFARAREANQDEFAREMTRAFIERARERRGSQKDR